MAVPSSKGAPALGSAAGASGANSAAAGPGAASQSGAGSAASGQTAGAAPGSYSTTNTATAGVDEPDIVKTDGHRIVTITGGVMRVVDAQTRQITGVLDLSSPSAFGSPAYPEPYLGGLTPANLLLSGNHALVLFNQLPYPMAGPPTGGGGSGTATSPPATTTIVPIVGPELALVDLSTGKPQIISEFTMDGSLVDARQVGSVARVIIHSAPRIYFPPLGTPGAGAVSAQQGVAPDRTAIARAGLSQWLPRYSVTAGGLGHTGLVDCASVSHPAQAAYSGSSMLTVLTFDLSGMSLGDGEPVTIVADGDTVYSDGASLYIASRQWNQAPVNGLALASPPANPTTATVPPLAATASAAPAATASAAPAATASAAPAATASAGPPVATTASAGSPPEPVAVPQYTGIYKFDISGPGRPVYEASGTVPGWVLGSSDTAQYSLSAWNGALRVATTAYGTSNSGFEQTPQSAVYELEQSGDQLVVVGKVGGLGAGEQIYAVRFAGPIGYVVTFRQVDPLYTLDLTDPAQPRVVGQLQLSGYSAYLYPIDATHLIGIGQDANAQGQTTGTQISLFDVSDPAAPVRQAVFDLQFGHSDAEFDPHAFLYWPATRLLVIPVQLPYAAPAPAPAPQPPPVPTPLPQGSASVSTGTATPAVPTYWPESEALVLHVGSNSFTKLGTITHPVTAANPAGGQIQRSLIVGNALWTLSGAGLKANDMATLTPLAWVPFSS